jgi:SAM-dependent methyltransferase
MKVFLDVGANLCAAPPYFAGWRRERLDIDPATCPDVLLDARELHRLPQGKYDAVYCAHNLEHYHRHDAVKVLRGIHHVLKGDGFLELRVPDLEQVIRVVAQHHLDVDDVLYESFGRPIRVRDVIYGYSAEIERTGNDFFAHKTGFTSNSLVNLVVPQGFPKYLSVPRALFEVRIWFFKQEPSTELADFLKTAVSSG